MNQLDNARYIYKQLTNAGLTAEAACGILGNMEAESGIEPTNLQNSYNSAFGMSDAEYTERVDNGSYKKFTSDQAGYGLCQWTFWSRKLQLMDFINARGYKSIGSLEGQTAYFLWDLETNYPHVWTFLKATPSVRGASNIILLRYECPADQSVSVQNYRAHLGERWYEILVAATIEEPVEEPKQESYFPPRMIDNGMMGADVTLLQAFLNCRGYGCRIDGIFSDDTDRKVRQFQTAKGLVVDGVVGSKTWDALFDRS